MAATLTKVVVFPTGAVARKAEKHKSPHHLHSPLVRFPWRNKSKCFRPVASAAVTPPELSKMVSESIKEAIQTCAVDSRSGRCRAAWDEVEELSAAASHIRGKMKERSVDPLVEFCKDNPERGECRMYVD